ncbi:unnamed protein product [Eruca vesicaria subsp. sativa]|uniref:Uncharacterized protein n=1 Tax=Eruca vesicaria subsp. sativa TaxID=29727 RepID=A0ABC8J6I9_ERUVS|nr:unnamed protein product [Eruca vesicaria subsp. sativa]
MKFRRGRVSSPRPFRGTRVFSQENVPLLGEGPAEVILALQERLLRVLSLLNHLGAWFSKEDVASVKEEANELSRQLSEEKSRRATKGMELHDLQAKIKAIEDTAETSSSEALALGRKNQKLEEALEKLRAEAKISEDVKVMAVDGAKMTS